MSVINRMLQELDRRNATAGSEAEQPPRQVKVVSSLRHGHEWFWRMVALLMLAAIAWVGWVAYQLQPIKPVATEQAFKAAEQAKKGPIGGVQAPTNVAQGPKPAPVAPPPPTQTPATPAPTPPSPPPAVAATPASPETLKLAQSIQTPIPDRAAPKAEPAPKPEALAKDDPPAKPSPPKASSTRAPAPKVAVDKRERTKPGSELADARFRRAALFLNQGRVSEAEDQLVGALQADPAHVPARQAYVALLLEQKRSDAARRVLSDALIVNPAQPTFALALARILAEQRDYAGALETMDRAGSVGKNADFLALRGAVLQRMNRHDDAIEAFQASVGSAPQPGTTWVGYAISLEALGRKADAAQAYRRSLGAGGLAREVRDYAEARIRALE